MKKEEIVKKILIRSLAGFPVGVMLLMLEYASVYFIVGDTVFNTELNQLHNINTLLTQIISVGISGYMLFAIFGIINVSGNKEVENNLIKKYPWKIALIILIEIILYLSYYIYLLIKKKYIGYKIIISNFIMCLIGILIIYISGNMNFVIDEDLSNIEESFSIYSFFIINTLYSLIFIITNGIKLLINKIKE